MRSLFQMLAVSLAAWLAWAAPLVASRVVEEPVRVGYGSVVLVGDGEVFVGESANNFRPGTVYVYRKTGGSWREAAKLTAPEAAVYDRFGSSLALDGTRLFVGAGPAAVHVFTKQGNDWTHTATVAASSVPADSTQFGNAVAAWGEWLLVGKAIQGGGGRGGGGGGRGGAAAGPQPPGAVFAFRRAGSGEYAYHATLSSPDAENMGDQFGSSVSLAGGTAMIGAAGQAGRAGVVHEFTVDASGAWTRERSFAPLGAAPGDAFGSAVLLDGDRALVTAPGDGGGHGAVYVLQKALQAGRGGGGGGGGQGNVVWQELVRVAAPVGTRNDGFGVAIAADDRELWVGAPGLAGVGGVYAFLVGRQGYDPTTLQFMTPDGSPGGAGRSISIRGAVAAVGASSMSATSREGVVIYERDAAGRWQAQPMIMAALDELAPVTGSTVRCSAQGKAGEFDCGNVELQAFLPPSRLTHDGHYVQMNDVWGWTDPETGKEWAIVGRRDGTTFVDVTDPSNPVPVADLPLTDGARPASWRDMKVYRDHAFVVSDGSGPHGMQVFDLTRLRTLAPVNGQPVMVRQDTTYREINSAHNIVINEESGFAYSVGSSGGGTTCAGGLHMVDIREPKNPRFAGCFAHTGTGRSGGGYTHDAQCVTYRGPDTRYQGREICLGANETAISIADVTDKANPRPLSQASYPRVAYAHQGWFSEDMKYWYLDDEIDEIQGVERTRTLIWDLSDLENPRLANEHMGVEGSSDHNQYVKGNLLYQANYKSGLRILDVSSPESPVEVGYLNTAPYMGTTPGYNGAWSVYPFFRSGALIVNSIEQGLFIVKYSPVLP